MEFVLSHPGLSSSNSDEELLGEIVINDQIAVQATIVCVNIWEYFTSIEPGEESEKSVNPDVSVWDILTTVWTTPSFLKVFHQFHFGKIWKIGSTCGLNQCWAILTCGLKIDKIFKLKTVGSHIRWKPN